MLSIFIYLFCTKIYSYYKIILFVWRRLKEVRWWRPFGCAPVN